MAIRYGRKDEEKQNGLRRPPRGLGMGQLGVTTGGILGRVSEVWSSLTRTGTNSLETSALATIMAQHTGLESLGLSANDYKTDVIICTSFKVALKADVT
ncbi:hypothetical protein Scep_014764 [Stephania cephalantha]|uniref:Uncharacterized protein n=1 Tax=Stephania cephalantha TaxID=152367 RepID=A0AAP0P0Q3_9MAGN